MSSFKIFMPHCGEDGVIVVTDMDTDVTVEFRGTAYSKWDESESSDFCKIHDSFKRVDISRLHCSEVEVCTPWHGVEYFILEQMFNDAVASIAK